MISGKLPNNTVWWLSTDGLKIWIESRDLEHTKFKEKGYNIVHGRIFTTKKDVGSREVGELTTSRLDSRRRQDAWILKVNAVLDIYPELVEEINQKSKNQKKSRRSKQIKINPIKEKIQKNNSKNNLTDTIEINLDNKYIEKTEAEGLKNIEQVKTDTEGLKNIEQVKTDTEDIKVDKDLGKKEIHDFFDINRPYVDLLKEEINKSERGKITISLKDLKQKMGEEFLSMHDLRIYFGLKKILSTIGIVIELRSAKGESIAVIKKVV